jgi:hypothetical protein
MLHGSADLQTMQRWCSHQSRDGEETETECGKAKRADAVRIGPVKHSWITFVLALALVAGCVTLNPPSPSAAPSATPGPTAPPQPASDLGEQVDAVVATVPEVRELEPTRDVPFELITREQFIDVLVELQEAEVPLEVREAEERLYKRLGLIAQDADLDALVQELYGAQVLAYYQPLNGHFYLIGDDESLSGTDKLVVAHEYTHALQDQHFDLNDMVDDYTQGDAQLAELAVVEGDATLTSQLWTTDNLSFEDLLQLLIEGFSQLDEGMLDGIPLVLRRQLEFAYTEGFTFVTALHEEGGFMTVNDALTTPPVSTEQIFHPEKYFAQEAPESISIRYAAGFQREWELVYEQTMGELGIQIIAAGGEIPPGAIPGLPVDWPHQEAAAGWAGDRLNMWEGPNDGWAIVWQTAWDTAADQDEFEARIQELVGSFDGVASVRDGQVIIASDQSTLGTFSSAVFPPQ